MAAVGIGWTPIETVVARIGDLSFGVVVLIASKCIGDEELVTPGKALFRADVECGVFGAADGIVVEDAIETLKREDGEKTVADWKQLGARLTTTDQALAALDR